VEERKRRKNAFVREECLLKCGGKGENESCDSLPLPSLPPSLPPSLTTPVVSPPPSPRLLVCSPDTPSQYTQQQPPPSLPPLPPHLARCLTASFSRASRLFSGHSLMM